MASNPYRNLLAALTAKPSNLLADAVAPTPKPELSPSVRQLVNVLMSSPASEPSLSGLGGIPGSGLGNVFGSLARSPFDPPTPPAPPYTPTFRPFLDLIEPPPYSPPHKASVKRKAFFSFHYDDIMRVNVVRNVWKIDHPDNALMRSFQDSSLWESRKLEGDDAVKRLIREGVEYTSAVCVLIGTDT